MIGARIVVVDVDEGFQAVIHEVLRDVGYEPIACTASQAALPIIQREQPALVILDPWLERAESGWEIICALRGNPEKRQLPVLLTTSDPKLCRQRASLLDADDLAVLEKPFDLEELLVQVERLTGPPGVMQRTDPRS